MDSVMYETATVVHLFTTIDLEPMVSSLEGFRWDTGGDDLVPC